MTCLSVMALVLVAALPAASDGLLNTPAPGFSLPDLDGNTVSLSEVDAKVIVLSFCTTWCPASEVEAVLVEAEIHKRFQDRPVTVYGIVVGETPDVVEAWQARLELTYPLLLDADYAVFSAYTMNSLVPLTVIIDTEGVVQYQEEGTNTERVSDITALVDSLLGAPGPGSVVLLEGWGRVKQGLRAME